MILGMVLFLVKKPFHINGNLKEDLWKLPVIQKHERISPLRRGSSHLLFCSSLPNMWSTSIFPVSVEAENTARCLPYASHVFAFINTRMNLCKDKNNNTFTEDINRTLEHIMNDARKNIRRQGHVVKVNIRAKGRRTGSEPSQGSCRIFYQELGS